MVQIKYKYWGITFEKQPRSYHSWIPLWWLSLGKKYFIAYHYFHSGIGFHVELPGIHLMIATKGKLAWWLEPGRGSITLFNFHKEW